MDGKAHRGVHHVSLDADALAAVARDEYLPWSPPRLLFTGRDQGCIEGRVNANGISSLARHGLCVYDGRLSLVFFRGRFLLYARANPTIGRRFVQVTSSVDLREWTPLRSIRLKGIIACDASIYTFTVQSHPLRNDRLVAFFPAVLGCEGSATPEGPHLFSHSGLRCKSRQRRFSDPASGALEDLSHLANASLMISCSADGHLWSQPFPLFLCRTIGHVINESPRCQLLMVYVSWTETGSLYGFIRTCRMIRICAVRTGRKWPAMSLMVRDSDSGQRRRADRA